MMKSLLLVDDEVALTETMKELLENAWLHVYTASDGTQALHLMRSQQIDCVVSDINMPVMDGLTFMQKTRELGSDVPFIFYSGHICEKL